MTVTVSRMFADRSNPGAYYTVLMEAFDTTESAERFLQVRGFSYDLAAMCWVKDRAAFIIDPPESTYVGVGA